jgi:hypothetical protein
MSSKCEALWDVKGLAFYALYTGGGNACARQSDNSQTDDYFCAFPHVTISIRTLLF